MFTRAVTVLTRIITNKPLVDTVCKPGNLVLASLQQKQLLGRPISCSGCRNQEEEAEGEKKKSWATHDPKMEGRRGYIPRQVDAQTSIQYMESQAYKDVYKDEPVWKPYRRNQKGQAPIPPRKTCIRAGVISTGSACPICRDDYLILDYRNIKLLRQFISDVTGEPIDYYMTGLCQKQIKRLELEIAKARDYGYLEKYMPFRQYNYQYYKSLVQKNKTEINVNQSAEHSEPQSVFQSSSTTQTAQSASVSQSTSVSQSASATQSVVSSSSSPPSKTVPQTS